MTPPNQRLRQLEGNGSSHSQPFEHFDIDSHGQIIPNDETQELYDHWKEAETELALNNHVQEQQRQGGPGSDHDYLRPPSLSAASMSRSISGASYTSITRGIDGMDLQDEQRSEIGKRKAGRHGPLNKCDRARTAFIRKLGACQACRARRVKCSHHQDRYQLLEQARQSRSRSQLFTSPSITSPTRSRGPASPVKSHAPGPHRQQTDDLIRCAIGAGDPSMNPTSPTHTDDILVGILPQQPGQQCCLNLNVPTTFPGSGHNMQNGTSSVNFLHRSGLPLHRTSAYNPQNNTMSSSDLFSNFPPQSSPGSEEYLPIGRELQGVSGGWECISGSSATPSLVSMSSGSSGGCGSCFVHLHELAYHYRGHHSQFRDADRPFLYKCLLCKALNDTQDSPCFQCRAQSNFEKWYYGYVSTQTAQSQSSISMYNQDPFFFAEPSSPSAPWSGQSMNRSNRNAKSYFGGANGGGNGGGIGGSSGCNQKWYAGVYREVDCFEGGCGEKSSGSLGRIGAHLCPISLYQVHCSRGSYFAKSTADDLSPAPAVRVTILLLLPTLIVVSLSIIESCLTMGCSTISISRFTTRII